MHWYIHLRIMQTNQRCKAGNPVLGPVHTYAWRHIKAQVTWHPIVFSESGSHMFCAMENSWVFFFSHLLRCVEVHTEVKGHEKYFVSLFLGAYHGICLWKKKKPEKPKTLGCLIMTNPLMSVPMPIICK